jgi:hypothetical protein
MNQQRSQTVVSKELEDALVRWHNSRNIAANAASAERRDLMDLIEIITRKVSELGLQTNPS